MMLDVVTALYRYDERDFWPFDHPEIVGMYPFASDS
jgi:hypothetical protein